nr:immunoglobulin heavy chain junction region [Mus musculus]
CAKYYGRGFAYW